MLPAFVPPRPQAGYHGRKVDSPYHPPAGYADWLIGLDILPRQTEQGWGQKSSNGFLRICGQPSRTCRDFRRAISNNGVDQPVFDAACQNQRPDSTQGYGTREHGAGSRDEKLPAHAPVIVKTDTADLL